MRTEPEGTQIRLFLWRGLFHSAHCGQGSPTLYAIALSSVVSVAKSGGTSARHIWFLAILSVFMLMAALALQDSAVTFGFLALGRLLGVRQGLRQERMQAGTSRLSEERISLESALRSLAEISESRDRELAGHSERVAANAVSLGRELGLGNDQLEELWWAGLLHDVGKIGLAESILHKAGPLSEAERREVRRHPEYGAEIVLPFARGLPAITDAIRHHHERWDGKGYPSGLAGSEIPLYARIVAIADVFEALTSSRPYRTALSAKQAHVYVSREASMHFDPTLVRAFDVVYRSNGLYIAEPRSIDARTVRQSVSSLLTTRVG